MSELTPHMAAAIERHTVLVRALAREIALHYAREGDGVSLTLASTEIWEAALIAEMKPLTELLMRGLKAELERRGI